MGHQDVLEEFCTQLEAWGISLRESQLCQFQTFYELLSEWNTRMNLTAITGFSDVCRKHYLDSLSIAKVADFSKITHLIDVGTGAGFPGIPLKIVFPQLHVLLLDSLAKRVRFLECAVEKLGLEHISCIHGRAEDVARDHRYRESFDVCVSRAVANLSSLSEYCLPFVKPEGFFYAYKSANIGEELQMAEAAIHALGGSTQIVSQFSIHDVGERAIIGIQKDRHTPKKYPRKAGLPSREPIQGC